jgi:disulfide oxidoreductase YuzD
MEIDDIFTAIQKCDEQRLLMMLSGEPNNDCTNLSIIHELFLKRNKIIDKYLLPKIKGFFSNHDFEKNFIHCYHKNLTAEKRKYQEKINYKKNLNFQTHIETNKMKDIEEKLLISSIDEFIQQHIALLHSCNEIKEMFNGYYKEFNSNEDGDLYIKENYSFIMIAETLYKEWQDNQANAERFKSKKQEVLAEYKAVGIDLETVDIQFDRYDLVSHKEQITHCERGAI